MFVRSFHASSIYLRRLASAFGPGSVAMTSNPRARYCAAQLAPMTPVPTIAIRLIGLLYDIIISPFWFEWFVDLNAFAFVSGLFDVGDASQVALGKEQWVLLGSVQAGGINA